MKLPDQKPSARRKKPAVPQPHLYRIEWIRPAVGSGDAAELMRLSFRFRDADIDRLMEKSRVGERTVIGISKMAAARDAAAALRLTCPFFMERE